MIVLTGNNLGERQRELNFKVAEAADKKTNIEEIKSDEEHSDVDRLFKIDLASKYKHIDYIVETLRCGDSLYITRALKCTWLYDDEFSNIINTGYLHNQLFPHMSLKMKKKMLTAISLHVRNEDRVICFYSYCINSKLNNLAFKFLMFTPEWFKTDLIENMDDFKLIDAKRIKSRLFLKQFIGNSFELALDYLDMVSNVNRKKELIYELRFLYSVSAEQYLNLLEDYEGNDADIPNKSTRLGVRISRDILENHKTKAYKSPVLYINKLNKAELSRHLTIEDIRTLAHFLLPSSDSGFWSINFYATYKFILDKIPANETYAFMKQLFVTKYNEKPFEMDVNFYELQYYQMLNTEEREEWALRHIEREEELLGSGNDYIWYKFVSFEKAFPGIKRYIFLTPDKDKRSEIVNILVESARNQSDLTQLLNYYYDRHVNESEEHKESFIDKVFAKHDTYAFEDECWAPLDKLLYSLEVYTVEFLGRGMYKMRSIFYHILNNKEIPVVLLHDFYEKLITIHYFEEIIKELSAERLLIISNYLFNYHAGKFKDLLEEIPSDKTKEQIQEQICYVWQIICCFQRKHDECPEIISSYMKSDMETWKYHPMFKGEFVKSTQEHFIGWLKTDLQMSVDGINEIRCNSYRWPFRLTTLFRKLKIYFSNDIAKEYLEYFTEYLSNLPESYREYRNVKMAVVGTLILANEENKMSFMEKYIPEDRKIDHRSINYSLLQIQKAICRLAYHSRPPLPISTILNYIKGDYVCYCLPLFNAYLTNLSVPSALEFTQSLIDSPLSKQKHGLRLAYQCFSAEVLVKLISEVWRKTKNISLRMLLYKEMFKKVVNEYEEPQKTLYELLKTFTLDLNHQDQEDVFDLLVSDEMPKELRGNYIETAWTAVSKLSNKNINLRRKTNVIEHMESNINLVQRTFIWQHVIEEHVRTVLFKNNIKSKYSSDEIENLIEAKWEITAKYIVNFNTSEELEHSLNLFRNIITKCVQTWSHEYKKVYTSREFFYGFLNIIKNACPADTTRCGNLVPIYQCTLDIMENSLLKEDMYTLLWPLKIAIGVRKIISEHFKSNDCVCEDGEPKYACVKRIAVSYGNMIGKLVKEMVAVGEFYCSMYTAIIRAIRDNSETTARVLNTRRDGFNILVGGCLTEFKMTETYIIALMIIPVDPPDRWEKEHKSTVEKIKQYNNPEVRSYLYAKFVNSDFSVRKYVV